jgi:hypothetical protein
LINIHVTLSDVSEILLVSGSISFFATIAFVILGIRKLSTQL